jgi:type I restriction enzyme M protein
MAVTEKIGHDKRGSITYRQTKTGEDLWVTRSEKVTELDPKTGAEISKSIEFRERVVDDELVEVVVAFKEWLKKQI